MESSRPNRQSNRLIFGLMGILSFLIVVLLGFIVLFPILRPMDFNPEELFQQATLHSNQGDIPALAKDLTLLSEYRGNTRFPAQRWIAWLNLARGLGRRTKDFSLLFTLAQKAHSEIHGNNVLQGFLWYARVKAGDWMTLPPERRSGDDPLARIQNRYNLEYYLRSYSTSRGQNILLNPGEILDDRSSKLWTFLASALSRDPSIVSRALLTSARDENDPEFLRFYQALSALNILKESSISASVWQRLAGLASFRLGRWDDAATYLEKSRIVSGNDISLELPLAESYFRLAMNRKSEDVLINLFERQNLDLPETLREVLIRNYALLLLEAEKVELALQFLEKNNLPQLEQFALYLRTALAFSRNASIAPLQNSMASVARSESSGLEEKYLFYAAFTDLITQPQLVSLLNSAKDDLVWSDGIAEMLLWDMNRRGEFQACLSFSEKYLSEKPYAYNVVRERVLAMSQLGNRAQEAFDLWKSLPPSERDFFWEYNAGVLASLTVKTTNERRDYSLALEHNRNAEFMLNRFYSSRSRLFLRARLLYMRAQWLYLMGEKQTAIETLNTAKNLDLSVPDSSILLGRWNEEGRTNETENYRSN